MNAIVVKGDAVGPTLYYGAGAGAEPTASSVIADLVDVARQLTVDPKHRVPYLAFLPIHSLIPHCLNGRCTNCILFETSSH